MLLYIWINNYRNISKKGFNISSKFNFTFEEEEVKKNFDGVKGTLNVTPLENIKLFPDNIIDFKVIVGENGAGKSTLLDTIIINLMTESNKVFDGFLVTDKYIIVRDESKIDFFQNEIIDLEVINDIKIVNYNRPEYKKIKQHSPTRLVESYLENNLTVYYSSLLNFDKVMEFEGVAGENDGYEYYERYLNISLENQIIRDYKINISDSNQYRLNGVSELLNFKIFETKRYLDFILNNSDNANLIFKNRINTISFRINSFYSIYWETIDEYFKTSEENLGAIRKVTSFIEEKSKSNNYGYTDLKSNLYKQFIYCVLKFEYDYRWGTMNKKGSNALIETLNLFVDSTKNKRTPHTILEAFLSKTIFNKKSKINIKLFSNIINYITDNEKIRYLYPDSFIIDIEQKDTTNELFRLFFENKDFAANNKYYLCNFLLIEFKGLSNGEKNLLSLFSRLYSSSKYYNFKNKEIIMLLDEPEVGLHPEWQTEFITKLLSFFNILFSENKIQILLTTHSPILLSDFPPNNVLYLKKDEVSGDCKIDINQNSISTFGANIHSLYANAFFLKDNRAAMGNVAKNYINDLIKVIKEKTKDKELLIKSIELIGEPLIKDRLKVLLEESYPSYEINVDKIDNHIQNLEKALLNARQIKAKLDENSK